MYFPFGYVLNHFWYFKRISDPSFKPKFEIPMAVSYSTTDLRGASGKFYVCFERKPAFVTQNFENLGVNRSGFYETPKHILGMLVDSTYFEPLLAHVHSRDSSPGEQSM